jgi:hypothetical protein
VAAPSEPAAPRYASFFEVFRPLKKLKSTGCKVGKVTKNKGAGGKSG